MPRDSDEPSIDAVAAYARKVAGSIAADMDPDDIAQDVMISYLRHRPVASWKSWIRAAVRNRRTDMLRSRSHRFLDRTADVAADEISLAIGHAAVGPSAGVIAAQQVSGLLRDLSSREREVFVAHIQGSSNADLAKEFGYASAAAAATVISRTRRKILALFPEATLDLEPERIYRAGHLPHW